MEEEQKILETIAKAIVNSPDEVKTKRTVDEMGILLTLQVAKKDMGVIIGRQGKHADAIKLVVKLSGLPEKKIYIKIQEPEMLDAREITTGKIDPAYDENK